jgi:malonate transporter
MDIIAVILPVFAIAVLGYVLTWLGAFRTQDVPGLTRYVFNIALPIMLFDSMSRVSLPAEIQWSFLLAYYLPAVGIYFAGVAIGRRFFHQPRTEQAIYGMGCAYSNTVLIGLPIISTAWGNTAVLPLMMIVSVHTAILFSLTTAVAE